MQFNYGLTRMDTDQKSGSVFIRAHPWLYSYWSLMMKNPG